MKKVRCDDCNESFAAQQIFEIDGHKLCNKCLFGNRNDVSASVPDDSQHCFNCGNDLSCPTHINKEMSSNENLVHHSADIVGMEPYLAGQPYERRACLESLHRTLLHLQERVDEKNLGLVEHCLGMLSEAFPGRRGDA